MASILKVDTIQDQSGNNIINESADTITIGASGDTITVPTGATMTVPSGGLTGQNYPAFEAYLGSTQLVSDNTGTKVQINTEVFDSNSCYDNVTNYRFTPNVAGKYFCYAQISLGAGGSADFNLGQIIITKNGSTVIYSQCDQRGNPSGFAPTAITSGIIDMNGSTDYIELFGLVDGVSAGSESFTGDATVRYTNFGAYRIGA